MVFFFFVLLWRVNPKIDLLAYPLTHPRLPLCSLSKSLYLEILRDLSIFNWFGNNFYSDSSCTDGCPLKTVSVKSSQTAVILTTDTKCLNAFSSFVEGKWTEKLKPIFLRFPCPTDLIKLPYMLSKFLYKEVPLETEVPVYC